LQPLPALSSLQSTGQVKEVSIPLQILSPQRAKGFVPPQIGSPDAGQSAGQLTHCSPDCGSQTPFPQFPAQLGNQHPPALLHKGVPQLTDALHELTQETAFMRGAFKTRPNKNRNKIKINKIKKLLNLFINLL
jgi:hypothetical protein